MCEITRKNFEEKYPQIIDDLHAASFISIDCEFSGFFGHDFCRSLFDTPKDVFTKLQHALEGFVIIQFGLSTFHYNRTSNQVKACSYTFYLVPSRFMTKRSKFTCEMGSVEFLCKHNFDFNKLFYDGICYLNKSDEAETMKMIQEETLLCNVEEKEIQKYCSKVREWVNNVSEGNEMLLNVENETETLIYLLHQEIRKRFPKIWTYYESWNFIKLKLVAESEKRKLLLDKNEEINLKQKLFKSLIGFSKIIKELEKLKKPIVGHNFLIDLMMIYKQFYDSSPVSYKTFKQKITTLFPNLYDTKYISYRLRDVLSKEETWTSNSLCELYSYLNVGRGATLVLFTPSIQHENKDFVNSKSFHDAGFDSYCTGFCFLKMSHIFSLWDPEKKSFKITSMPMTSSWLLGAINATKNRLPLSLAQVNYIVLDGCDPTKSRPGLLHIQSRQNRPLNVPKILEEFAKYGFTDLRLFNKYRGLLAVPFKRQVKEIIDDFKNHKEFQVSKYSYLRHSNLSRIIAGLGIITSGLLISIVLLNKWKSNS